MKFIIIILLLIIININNFNYIKTSTPISSPSFIEGDGPSGSFNPTRKPSLSPSKSPTIKADEVLTKNIEVELAFPSSIIKTITFKNRHTYSTIEVTPYVENDSKWVTIINNINPLTISPLSEVDFQILINSSSVVTNNQINETVLYSNIAFDYKFTDAPSITIPSDQITEITLKITTMLVSPSSFDLRGKLLSTSTINGLSSNDPISTNFLLDGNIDIFTFSCDVPVSWTAEIVCLYSNELDCNYASLITRDENDQTIVYKRQTLNGTIAESSGVPGNVDFIIDQSSFYNIKNVIPEDNVEAFNQNDIVTSKYNFDILIKSNFNGIIISKIVNIAFTPYSNCPVGTFGATGFTDGGCSKCPKKSYQDTEAQTTCLSCPEAKPETADVGTTSINDCVPGGGFFKDINGEVKSCIDGFACRDDDIGVQVSEILLEPGYWRTSNLSSEPLKCPNENWCNDQYTISSTNDICVANREGVFCSACIEGYSTRAFNDTCVACSTSDVNADFTAFLTTVIVFLLIFVILIITFLFIIKYLEIKNTDLINNREDTLIQIKDTNGYITFLLQRRGVKTRILVGLAQVLTGLSFVFTDDFPKIFNDIAQFLAIFSFSFLPFFDAGCSVSNSHYLDLILSLSLPIAILFVFIISVTIGEILWNKILAKIVYKKLNLKNKNPIPTNYSLFQTIFLYTKTFVVIETFVVYPSVSSVIFKTFVCDEFGGNVDGEPTFRVLRTDYAVSCDTEEYNAYFGLAILGVFIYPIGIFVFYSYLLLKVVNFNPKKLITRGSNFTVEERQNLPAVLTVPYRKTYYYFELVELLRKLFMTSLSIFFIEGSGIQLLITLIGALLFLVLMLNVKPYTEIEDNTLAISSLSCLVIVVAIAFANRLDISEFDERYYNPVVLDAILIIATFFPLFLTIIQLSLATYKHVKSGKVDNKESLNKDDAILVSGDAKSP